VKKSRPIVPIHVFSKSILCARVTILELGMHIIVLKFGIDACGETKNTHSSSNLVDKTQICDNIHQ